MTHEAYDILSKLKGKRKGGTIEDWHLFRAGEPSETGTGQICRGRIVDDKHHGTGMSLSFRTSQVVHHYVEDNIIETLNTFYMLGEEHIPTTPLTLTHEEEENLNAAIDLLSKCII